MTEFRAGDHAIIRKLKYRSGDLWMMWQWDETIWHAADNYFVGIEWPTMLFTRPDDVWVGTHYALLYFYPNEPFYFYELYAADPPYTFEGWYCNLNTVPERTTDGYSFIDIDLDIYLNPDLTYKVLDEDEYREHRVRYQYTAEMQSTVEDAMQQVLERIRNVVLPFRPNVRALIPELESLSNLFQKPMPTFQRPLVMPMPDMP